MTECLLYAYIVEILPPLDMICYDHATTPKFIPNHRTRPSKVELIGRVDLSRRNGQFIIFSFEIRGPS